jgi:hypothetical protein
LAVAFGSAKGEVASLKDSVAPTDFDVRWLVGHQSPFVRQSFGSLDVLFNEGLLCAFDLQGLHHDRCSFAPFVTPRRARIEFI